MSNNITSIEASHSLNLGGDKLKIRHENRRLYKFLDWRSSENIIRRFLKSKLVESTKNSLPSVDDFKITMDSVNPMRRSVFGNFYLDVKGKVLTKTGDKELGEISEFMDPHVNISSYDTYDVEEKTKRGEIERKFGSDQYNKELGIRTQALEEYINTIGGKLELNLEDKSGIDLFIKNIFILTGWEPGRDNRIHSRIKRLPLWMEVPE